jgi:predicted molibdopterin-dependent oxidoreductase YjgC
MIKTDKPAAEEISTTITLTMDGREIETRDGATVLEAALASGIIIPTLCHDPDLKPYGACRLCVVEIEGMRGLVPSCTTLAREGMVIQTNTAEVKQSRRITMELIIANHPANCLTCAKNQDCRLQHFAGYLGVDPEHCDRLRKSTQVLPVDRRHPAFEFDPNKCILCAKCVRACHEVTCAAVIDLSYRGYDAKISTFGDKSWVEANCRSCGDCVDRCPTGALVPKNEIKADRSIKTVCPYCGVGCSLYLGVRDNQIVNIKGDKKSPVNKGGLCVKGRFGFDFVKHPERLTRPLIRKKGVGRDVKIDKSNYRDFFREAAWEEALELVTDNLTACREKGGPDSIGVLSSAKFTNEENYVVQKFARAVIGTNNVDHCARL